MTCYTAFMMNATGNKMEEVRGVYDVIYYIEDGSQDVMQVIAEGEDHAQEKLLRV